MKLYMVIEHFAPGAKEKIYGRFHRKGRMLPSGLCYLNIWLEKDGDRCFQPMETNDPRLFDVWFENWRACGRIEIGEKPKKDSWPQRHHERLRNH